MVDGSVVAEILEARKKKGKKGKKDDSLPGPLIGYLMKKGVIGKGKKKYRKPKGVRKKLYKGMKGKNTMTDLKWAASDRADPKGRLGKWKKG